MIFKNITFKHTNADIDNSIHEFVSLKLTSLEKYISEGVEARVEVEFEKVAAQNSGPICRVEMNVWVDGTLYRAEATEMTYEAAVDEVRGELDQEMRKAHKKRNSMVRKGGRMIKNMMRFGRKE